MAVHDIRRLRLADQRANVVIGILGVRITIDEDIFQLDIDKPCRVTRAAPAVAAGAEQAQPLRENATVILEIL